MRLMRQLAGSKTLIAVIHDLAHVLRYADHVVAMNLHLPFIEWIGAVVTGVYWFDVRPQQVAHF